MGVGSFGNAALSNAMSSAARSRNVANDYNSMRRKSTGSKPHTKSEYKKSKGSPKYNGGSGDVRYPSYAHSISGMLSEIKRLERQVKALKTERYLTGASEYDRRKLEHDIQVRTLTTQLNDRERLLNSYRIAFSASFIFILILLFLMFIK